MDYPSYVAKGWAIGSGRWRSACKTVIGQRMKGSGMRWGHDGADGVCHLRALLLSEKGQWDAFWAHPPQGGVGVLATYKTLTPATRREDDEEHIVRWVGQVVRVSVETVKIVNALPGDCLSRGTESGLGHS